jgi:hypothetical protein
MNRRLLVWAFPTLTFLLVASLIIFLRDFDQRKWPEIAADGCQAGAFTIPQSLIPPELRDLLGDEAPAKEAELRDLLLVTINELAARELPNASVNFNCKIASYDSTALNVYLVGNDPQNRFRWAKGTILTRSDAHQVLVLGNEFWNFFGKAWEPILNWRKEVSNRELLKAFGDYYFELYELYLEWAIAHELGHMHLGHHPQWTWWGNQDQQRLELEADIEAAKTIRRNYMQITPQLLGLVNETMKYEFQETYDRPWSISDGEPFRSVGDGFISSSWRIQLNFCNSTHPPFLLRSLSMIEASAEVGIEQVKQISDQQRNSDKAALMQEGSVESQLALEEMQTETLHDRYASRWSTALLELVRQLRGRIILHHEFFNLNCH